MSRLLLASLLALWVAPVQAIPPDTSDPRVIMDAVEARELGDRSVGRLEITITDKAGRKRSRAVQTRAIDVDEARKQLMLFESPADVRNAGLLAIDYDGGSRSDDQWLFLPSLGKTTRISGADRSGSFMGTDLTYADMTRRDTDAYDYTLVESTEVAGEACWLIEAKPRSDKERSETGYVKSQTWISKGKLVPLQVKAWVAEGKRLKYTQFKELKQLDGTWIAHQILVRTVRNGEVESASTLTFTELKLNQESVVPEDFTDRRLEQGL